FGGQGGRCRIESHVPGTVWNLDHLDEPLRGCADGRRVYGIFRLAAMGRVSSSPIGGTFLFIFDADTAHLPARSLPHDTGLPVLYMSGDIDALDLGIDRALVATGFLFQVIGDVHLVSAALLLGFGRA